MICANCSKVTDGSFCSACGHANATLKPTEAQMAAMVRRSEQRHGVPALLSFFVPGVGQLVKGNVGTAFTVWLGMAVLAVLVGAGLWPSAIGIPVIWLWQLYDAYVAPDGPAKRELNRFSSVTILLISAAWLVGCGSVTADAQADAGGAAGIGGSSAAGGKVGTMSGAGGTSSGGESGGIGGAVGAGGSQSGGGATGGAGACGTALLFCGGACVTSSNANCGACGIVCTSTQVCAKGVCAETCATGTTACSGGTCANTMTDPLNCGTCGTVCSGGSTCTAGSCVGGNTGTGNVTGSGNTTGSGNSTGTGNANGAGGTAGSSPCGGTDLQRDPSNCGTCGHVCPTGDGCSFGACCGDMAC